MSVFLQPIYTQTVGSGGANSVLFNNIPQTFTDLKLVVSGRTTASAQMSIGYMQFGTSGTIDSSTNYSRTYLQAYGTGSYSGRNSSQASIEIDQFPAAGATANTFGSIDFYIPNYTSSNFKSIIYDDVAENNSTTDNNIAPVAALWRNTNPISMLLIYTTGANFVQYSTFSLYGVLRQGI